MTYRLSALDFGQVADTFDLTSLRDLVFIWLLRLSDLPCAVLCTTVVNNDTHTSGQLLYFPVGLVLGFVFVLFCVGLYVSCILFLSVAFVVFGLVL